MRGWGRPVNIAVCENSAAAAEQLCGWIEQYCRLYHIPAVLKCFLSSAAFTAYTGWLDIAYLFCGGSAGFYLARQLRERSPDCKIILVDDTQEFAVHGMRLHCTDFILRPVEFRHIVRSMDLALRGWK